MARTPTPWLLYCEDARFPGIESENGSSVVLYGNVSETSGVRGDRKTAKANAAFIVRACNAHDELLSACLGVRAMLQAMGEQIPAMLDNAITIGQGGTVGIIAGGDAE